MVSDRWSPARETSPSRRRRMPGIARRALRWGLLGGACCFLSWCGLTAVSAGTANAATTDSTGLTAVTGQSPVQRLVGDVDAAASDLVELTGAPADAGADPESSRQDDEPAPADTGVAEQVEDGIESTRQLTKDIDRLTRVATSLHHIGVPSEGPDTTTSSGVVHLDAPTDGGFMTDAPTGSDQDAVSPHGATVSQGSSPADARQASDGHRSAADVPASADRAGDPTTITLGDGGDGDTPVQPFDPRAFSSSTSSSSSAGSGAFDGGSGARVIAFHLPHVARSVTMPAVDGVEVPWNPAGKPRVSPD